MVSSEVTQTPKKEPPFPAALKLITGRRQTEWTGATRCPNEDNASHRRESLTNRKRAILFSFRLPCRPLAEPVSCLGRNAAHISQQVVPAKAGTHNHRCVLLRPLVAPASQNTNIGGYGSRIALAALTCPGRRRSRLRLEKVVGRVPGGAL